MHPALLNPQLASLLGQNLPAMGLGPDPLAPLPEAPAPQTFSSTNDGINSVGRPSDVPGADAAAAATLAAKAQDRDKLLKKLKRQNKGEALLAFGAAMMSAPNFGEGLSKGLLGYAQAMKQNRNLGQLKSESVGGGEFERITDPLTGEVTFKRTPIADYKGEILDKTFGQKKDLEEIKQDGRMELGELKEDRKDGRQVFDWRERNSLARFLEGGRNRRNSDDNVTAIAVANIRAKASANRPNTGALKLVDELSGQRDEISNSLDQIGPVMADIQSGKLQFGLVSNGLNKVQNATGLNVSDEAVRYGQFTTAVESLRNAYLLASKGVQTDGDAQRAYNALLAGTGNTETVKANMATIINYLQKRQRQINDRISQVGGSGGYEAAPAPSPAPAASGKTSTGVGWRRVQ